MQLLNSKYTKSAFATEVLQEELRCSMKGRFAAEKKEEGKVDKKGGEKRKYTQNNTAGYRIANYMCICYQISSRWMFWGNFSYWNTFRACRREIQHTSVHLRRYTSEMLRSRDHFFGLGLGLIVIGLGLGLGLMR